MGVLMTILYVLLFLVCLSVLIIVHELGHLTAAKIFKVYCLEFSCGMGPLLWKHKKKNGETQFSLRAIPFGGYVSMYGEGVELPEGVNVDPSRSLHAIKKWKQAIIMLAGVTMNAALALFVFFIGNIACEQHSFVYINQINVADDSICSTAGLKRGDILSIADKEIWNDIEEVTGSVKSCMLEEPATVILNDDSTYISRVVLVPATSYKNPYYSFIFYGYEEGTTKAITTISYVNNIKSISMNLKTKIDKDTAIDHPVTINFEDGKMPDFGLRIDVKTFRYTFGEAFVQTFKDFGRSATAVFKGLGAMITGKVGVDQMSGIVGIGFEAKTILDELDVATFIYLWGLISVNLAIFNLLPFPGLDGWQLLVLIVEGITHKKIPDKVKNVVAFVGLIILLGFMAFILFKDIFKYMIPGIFSGWLW